MKTMMKRLLQNTWLEAIRLYPDNFRGRDRLITYMHPKLFTADTQFYASRNIGDLTMRFDLEDRLQAAMYYGVYERCEIDFLRKALGLGQFFIDVGAHIGYFSAVALREVGRRGRVLCFEPNPVMYERLSEMVCQATELGYQIRGKSLL